MISAQADWNAKSAPGYFTEVPDSDPTNIDIYQLVQHPADNRWAEMAPDAGADNPGSWCVSGTYYSNVWLNNHVYIFVYTDPMTPLNGTQRRRVFEHELGHAYGLSHAPVGCSGPAAVMVQGESKWTCGWGGTPPWMDDQNGVNVHY